MAKKLNKSSEDVTKKTDKPLKKGKIKIESKKESNEKSKANKDKTSNKQESLNDNFDILKGFRNTTSRVVQQAASILEEEIAAGIIAAKQVEKNFLDLNNLRTTSTDGVIQRFRKDAHEVVDMLLDLMNGVTKYVNQSSKSDISIQNINQEKGINNQTDQFMTLKISQPLKAGESGEVIIKLDNNSEEPSGKFKFHCTDLINLSGNRILSEKIIFEPSLISIDPYKSTKITITIKIPKGVQPGEYSGLIQANKVNKIRAILSVKIV